MVLSLACAEQKPSSILSRVGVCEGMGGATVSSMVIADTPLTTLDQVRGQRPGARNGRS